MAQSTGDFTREELKKDVNLAWSDKTKAEIAAAKGGSSKDSETEGGDPQNPGDGDGLDQD